MRPEGPVLGLRLVAMLHPSTAVAANSVPVFSHGAGRASVTGNHDRVPTSGQQRPLARARAAFAQVEWGMSSRLPQRGTDFRTRGREVDPLPEAATTPAEIRAAAVRAAAILRRPGAFTRSKVAMGPIPSEELRTALLILRKAPLMFARCELCGYRVAKWELNAERGAIQPGAHPNSKTTPGWEPTAWIDKANAGKGRVNTGSGGGDGLGTQNYLCTCGRNIPVKAERRMELFLAATAKGERKATI